MMVYLILFYRFFLTGLMAVGGGLATLPFLQEIGADTGWFTAGDLADMIAVSESTPGPIGVNMATYVGYRVGNMHYGFLGGLLGGTVATLSLVLPSLLVMLAIAKVMAQFKESPVVKALFRGLRPASMAMITVAGISVARIVLVDLGAASVAGLFRWMNILVFIGLYLAMKKWKLHPIAYIGISAVIGVVLGL